MTGDPRRPPVLVVGFGPFPGVPENPSAGIATAIARDPLIRATGQPVVADTLPTSYRRGLARLEAAIGKHRPRAVLLLGVARRSVPLTVETRFVNAASPVHADVDGRHLDRPEVVPGGPATGSTRASAEKTVAGLRRAGASAALSRSAGRYLCNAAGYLAARNDRMRAKPVLFVHLGPAATRKAGHARTVRALALLLRTL